MATNDPNGDILATLNTLFDRMERISTPFNESGSISALAVPQEMGVGGGQIQPAGWVENADGSTGQATVIIDNEGLHIYDGKIFIEDYAGASVLSSSGFSGSWIDFVSTGIYNASFEAATTDDITAATIVGTASTEDDYEDSLSIDIPYWIISAESGAGSFNRVANSGAPGGYALQWVNVETGTIIQDVPITANRHYNASFLAYQTAATGKTWSIKGQFRKADHSSTGSSTTFTSGGTLGTTNAWVKIEGVTWTGAAPADARYLRIEFSVVQTGGSQTFYLGQVRLREAMTDDQLLIGHLKARPNSVGSASVITITDETDTDTLYIRGTGAIDFIAGGHFYNRSAVSGIMRLVQDDDATGVLEQGGVISPTALTADVNNYAPTNGGGAFMWRLSSDATPRTITGIGVTATQGSMHYLSNINTGTNIILAHQSGSSTSVLRFICPNGANLTLRPGGSVWIVYDGTTARWRVMGA